VHRPLVAALLVLALPAAARAQSSPFLPDPLYRLLVNEISGDRAFENDRHLSHYHRTAGSRDFFAAAEWIRQAAVAAGLTDVRLVRQKYDGHDWSCLSGEAWLVAPEELKLAAYGEVAVSIADHSRTTHLTADLVDVGPGAAARDYEGKDVKGRIVLAGGGVSAVQQEAVWKRGALGVLSYATNRPEHFDAPDQVAWGRLPYEARGVDGVADGTASTFAVMVSPRRGRALQKRLQAGEALKVRVDIESAYPAVQEQAFVEGWIRGTDSRLPHVVLTAHIQEEMTSANDDGSGCANLLEIGRAVGRLIKDGKLPRPRRDLRFWWVNEFASQEQFFAENPQEPRRMLVDLNQDMVGARQSWGGRVQYASRLPWSLPHALDDVMESVLTMVRDGNTSLLTTRGTRLPVPFTRELVAVKGSREPFHARLVPYFDSTDHHAFTPARIGVPAVSLTNWPDEFIHSTGDDLEQIDATQLERNAVVVAGVALYFASAGRPEAAVLARYVEARGASRVAADLATGVALIAQAPPDQRLAAWRSARGLVRQSRLREAAAVSSALDLGRTPDGAARRSGPDPARLAADLQAIDGAYLDIAGQAAEEVPPTPVEKEMAALVYAPVTDIGKQKAALDKAKGVEGLHAMMRFEAYNFADGHRNAWEVYEAVAAEALSAGEWYYGRVTPEDVREQLKRAAEAGAFTLK
jgi:peptidase M28-like protein